MTTNTITIKGIREAARAYEARKYTRIALRLRALAVKAETGEINPEQAIEEFRKIEAQHRIPYHVARDIALRMEPVKKTNRPRKRYPSLLACAVIVALMGAIIAIAYTILP